MSQINLTLDAEPQHSVDVDAAPSNRRLSGLTPAVSLIARGHWFDYRGQSPKQAENLTSG